MGIACERCAIVYLVTRTGNNRIACSPRTLGAGMFVLACSCGGQQSFHKNDLRPYGVSERDYARAYAKPGEYSAQPKTALAQTPRSVSPQSLKRGKAATATLGSKWGSGDGGRGFPCSLVSLGEHNPVDTGAQKSQHIRG
jgi:hypothetical protein